MILTANYADDTLKLSVGIKLTV